MNGLPRGYDAWKTASPYDDDYEFIVDHAIAEHDLICPSCQEPAEWFRDMEEPSAFNDLTAPETINEGWHCENCDWAQESCDSDYARLSQYNESLKPRILAVRRTIANSNRESAYNIDQYFDFTPDGDFKYEDDGGGDWHVYCCGERDCDYQWHRYYPTVDIGCENGKRYVVLGTTDAEGNHDIDYCYDEREGDAPEQFPDTVGDLLANQSRSYFIGWTEYWLDCAVSGTDILGESWNHLERQRSGKWMEFCVDAAESMSKYL